MRGLFQWQKYISYLFLILFSLVYIIYLSLKGKKLKFVSNFFGHPISFPIIGTRCIQSHRILPNN